MKYRKYFENLLTIYKVENFHNLYKKLYRIKNSTVCGLTIYYNCSNNNVSIENPGFSYAVILDENLNFMNTSVDQKWINFTVNEKRIYNVKQNICIFRGYIATIKEFNNMQPIIGTRAILYIIDNLSSQNVSEEFLLLVNKIEKDFNIRLVNDTIEYYNNYFRILLQ
ncbi:MAG TPA: hypothetical protein EYH22_01465 [Candidatus Nanopusillus sp.]|nr:hypothetical protein [Candidatus Nanopusillus sp.]